MKFQDEYEYVSDDGVVYDVEVEVLKTENAKVVVKSLLITDGLGNDVDENSELYENIKLDAMDRDYDIEVHSNDFDFYQSQLNGEDESINCGGRIERVNGIGKLY